MMSAVVLAVPGLHLLLQQTAAHVEGLSGRGWCQHGLEASGGARKLELGGDVDEQDEGLQAAIARSRWPDGRPVYTLPVALSIMVFFALCAQCAATLMVIKRETNSWRWPIFTFVYMTGLAYLAALLTYQVGHFLSTGFMNT